MTLDKPCIISDRAKDKDGYSIVGVSTHGTHYEHRYVYATHHGIKLKSTDIIMHECDNPACIEITHLKLGTHKDNIQDSIQKGRHSSLKNKGSKNPGVRLTEDQVREIRRMDDLGFKASEIAPFFHVSRTTVHDILQGTTWKDFK